MLLERHTAANAALQQRIVTLGLELRTCAETVESLERSSRIQETKWDEAQARAAIETETLQQSVAQVTACPLSAPPWDGCHLHLGGRNQNLGTAFELRGGGNRAPGPHRNTARQAMDGLWTEVCGQQKQSNDPGNNQHILNTPIIGRR